ncbi:MAG: DMT family transporter, partial [Muribaculaceae bacterium]|nr:DMT family transporter [Muribaculaceae bacterium]
MAKLERISKSHYIKILAHIAILLTMCAWGTSFISTKVLMVDGGLTPVEVYIYRFVMAYVLLLLLTFRQIKSHSWKDELQLMLCGMCAGSLYFVTENYALKYTTTGNVSLLGSISPIFTTILISVIYKTRMKPGVILGSVIAFIGVGSIVFSNGDSIEIRPAGDLLALSA